MNLSHNRHDALLFLQDAGDELVGWEMLEVFLGVGVLAVQVAVIGEQSLDGDAPSVSVLDAVLPPGNTLGEVFVLHRLGFAVAVASLWQGQFIIPDFTGTGRVVFVGRTGVEEEQVGWNAGVGGEDAIGQAHDGM